MADDVLTRRVWTALFDVVHDESLKITAKRSLLGQLRFHVLNVELYLTHRHEQLTQRGRRSIVGIHWNEIHLTYLKTPWNCIDAYFIFLPQATIKSDSHEAAPKWVQEIISFIFLSFWNLVG